jgi:hypothetical protein
LGDEWIIKKNFPLRELKKVLLLPYLELNFEYPAAFCVSTFFISDLSLTYSMGLCPS